jgi:carbamoyl-phosphate synthase large subunit
VELIEAFGEAMRTLGLEGLRIAADLTDTAPACRLADASCLLPRVDDPGYGEALGEVVSTHAVRLVVPLTDLDLALLADLASRLGQRGCTAAVGSAEAVAICRDKEATARAVEAAGLEGLRTASLAAFEREPFYPCFVKPRNGSGGQGAARIDTPTQLSAHVERFGGDLIVQECIDGQEFTVDVYRDRSGRVRCVVPRLRLAVRSGEVEKGVTVDDAGIIEGARRLVESIDGLWGAVCCQCRRPVGRSGPGRFFEINPRFGGGCPLSIAAGADLPRYLLEEVVGRELGAGGFRAGVLMLRYDRSVFARAGRIEDLPGYDRPRFR